MTIYCGTWADWIQPIATVALFLVALGALAYARHQLGALKDTAYQQRQSTLMSEITSDDAGNDRGLVRKTFSTDTEASKIKQYVEKGRSLTSKLRYANLTQTKPDISNHDYEIGLIGVAIEKTIVRYDRVALLVLRVKDRSRDIGKLKDIDKLQLIPPDWVLADVNMIWARLHKWIEFRRTTEEDEYKNPQYARDLERLFNHKKTMRLRHVNHD